jgi:hypothetical protein
MNNDMFLEQTVVCIAGHCQVSFVHDTYIICSYHTLLSSVL